MALLMGAIEGRILSSVDRWGIDVATVISLVQNHNNNTTFKPRIS